MVHHRHGTPYYRSLVVDDKFKFEVGPKYRSFATDLRIGIFIDRVDAMSLGGYKSMCESFANRLRSILHREAYPALDTLTIEMNAPVIFSDMDSMTWEFPESFLIRDILSALRELPVKRRVISVEHDWWTSDEPWFSALDLKTADHRASSPEDLLRYLARTDKHLPALV